MASFVVLEPEGLNEKAQADATVIVRDGFAFFALIVPFFWLLSKRLWLEAFVVFAAILAIGSAATTQFAPVVPFLIFLVSVLVALEGNDWQIAKLRRRGYVEKAVIDANDLGEAEIRYFVDHADLRQPPESADTGTETIHQQRQLKSPPQFPHIGSQIGLVSHRGDNS
ncbi:hypothetical protein FHS77_001320 [Paenochrobactrum gallinarii]|uniref:DUF2628 domain-containing protein n=1 Tax=Paenochrobactrum gallinarii TaxID=643673 RepID=A0A841LYT5_9HYPH|nr:DUF2628 domain-containing protein [Paenochrobactrum gallinarii]MBB6260779.1 hypothetical protein [Paenochrobactrum gallinarii]